LYSWIVGITGIVLLGLLVILQRQQLALLAEAPFIALLVLFIILELNHLPVKAGLSVSLSFSSVLASYLTYGEFGACAISFGALGVGMLKKKSTRVLLFNTSSVFFSALAGGKIARLFDSVLVFEKPSSFFSPSVGAFVVPFMLTNALLVLGYWVLNDPVRRIYDIGYNGFLYIVHVAIGSALAFSMLVTYTSWGIFGFCLSCMAIAATATLVNLAGKYTLNRESLVNLYQATSSFNEALTLKQVFDKAQSSLRMILDVDFAWLSLPSGEGENVFSIEHSWAKPGIDAERAKNSILSLPRRRRVMLRKSVFYWNREKDKFRDGYFGTVLTMPLKYRGEIIGEFGLARVSSQEIQSEILDMLSIFTSHMVLAVRNAIRFDEVAALASTDSLTGLYNYREFRGLLSQMIDQAKESDGTVSLIYIDLDYFRQVNNRYGHQVGDEVLREIAAVIRKSCREKDIVCRPGGDEFSVILPGVSKERARRIAERIKDNIAKSTFTVAESLENLVGASVGVATFPEDGFDVYSLVQSADMDMYEGKTLSGDLVLKES